MEYKLFFAWLIFACGYLGVAVPMIGQSFSGFASGYREDFKVGIAVHVGILVVLIITALIGVFLYSGIYLVEYYI